MKEMLAEPAFMSNSWQFAFEITAEQANKVYLFLFE